ncbi:MAG: SDR family NAD(P)-dependent oxidoreductase [Eubacterium sp.]|nr:SDR family NAD(P)-dependent oxidoreductase [Eubacterium sp.]
MRICLITGASSGMGKEFVKLAMQGREKYDEIWVIARRKDRLDHWPRLYKDQSFRILALDLGKEDQLKLLHEELNEVQPQIDLMIHCAGFGIMGQISEIPPSEQMEMVDVNCRTVAGLTSILLPFMAEGSGMIYLASAAAFLPQPDFAVYAASKSFVLSYVRALRREVKNRNIRVTAVCPGAVKTEFFNRAARQRHLPAYKKLVMADPEKVVKKALEDCRRNREISVYGKLMKLFHLAAKILPHRVILHFL